MFIYIYVYIAITLPLSPCQCHCIFSLFLIYCAHTCIYSSACTADLEEPKAAVGSLTWKTPFYTSGAIGLS